MSNLSKNFITFLEKNCKVVLPKILSENISKDGSTKWLFDVGMGNAIETVLIPDIGRKTLCISSQVGCAIDCSFCATGKQGFSRNLTSNEIISQLWLANKLSPGRISNVVMMGMGEPLLNYNYLLSSLKLMLSDLAYGLSKRRVTVSTSGIVPMIDKLSIDCPISLAISLHSGNDALRNELVPINKKYPLKVLLEACKRYQKVSPRDFITFEIVMLRDVNDSILQANEIVSLISKYEIKAKFNLIPFNSFFGSNYESSTNTKINAFKNVIQNSGYIVTTRKTRGDDISAACGQLAGEVINRIKINKSKVLINNCEDLP
jgi:23S rRNA (adenine2503-C2)-methyltransferase